MLWLRGLTFTLLVPMVVGVWVPSLFDETRTMRGGWRALGWAPVAVGASFYLASLLRFLQAGGTPSNYFLRPLRFALGEEPPVLVERGLYRITRNPMYVGVVTAVLGQAVVFGSWRIALYGALLWLWFHFVVRVLEEPHLRKKMGPAYEEYCRRVPRWLGSA